MATSLMASCNKEVEPTIKAATKLPEEKLEMDNIETYCLFGLDTRVPENKGRSDFIMLITVNNENKNIKLVSVYRDTLMDDGGLDKCNAAYAYGGAYEAMDMLERNLDLSIKGYVSMDFLAAINAIDKVGGIDLDITGEEAYFANSYVKSMNKLYDKSSPELAAGEQHLDGLQTVAYARVRYTEGWDYKRTERQRTVLELLVEKLRVMPENERNEIILELLTDMNTDLSQTYLTQMVDAVINYDITDSYGFPKYKKGMSFTELGDCVVPDDLIKNVIWLHKNILDEEDYKPSEEVKRINSMVNDIAG